MSTQFRILQGPLKVRLQSFLQLSQSCFCTVSVDKGLLGKLRKQTGIPFIKCRKALEMFDNDFDQAKSWLQEQAQKEGWARATKLQTRPMSQGLVAVLGNHAQTTMVEVNCETDFVAKNENFIEMVTKLVQECNSHFEKLPENKMTLDKSQLSEVMTTEQVTLGDIVALNVGNLGENMALRRAAFLRAGADTFLASYVHPSGSKTPANSVLLGKYGAVIELRPKGNNTAESLSNIGNHLCQHIVGMNPKKIGKSQARETSSESSESGSESDGKASSSDEEDAVRAETEDEEELIHQEFLLDTSMTVEELLAETQVEVSHFLRYACGEELEGEKDGEE